MAKFIKGQSGNPGGRPVEAKEVRALALAACPDAIRELIRLSQESSDERTRVVANKEILDRGLGKAAQAVELTGAEGAPLTIIIGQKEIK